MQNIIKQAAVRVGTARPASGLHRMFYDDGAGLSTYNTALAWPGFTITKPVTSASTGVYVFDLRKIAPLQVALGFLMTDAADETGEAYVCAYNEVKDASDRVAYVPRPLLSLTMRAGDQTGAASGHAITDSHYFADLVTVVSDYTLDDSADADGPDDTFGRVRFDPCGAQLLWVRVKRDTCASLAPVLWVL